jgi:hypothetical protein
LTPVQVTVAPFGLVIDGVPLTEQLPPPGSVYTGPPVMVSADAELAKATNIRTAESAVR